MSLIIDGKKVTSCIVDNKFDTDKRSIFLNELSECKIKTFFLIDNNNDIIYRVIIS